MWLGLEEADVKKMWAVVPLIFLLFFFGINHAESKAKCVEVCPGNWKKMENHCYFWSSDTKKWEEAEEYCKEKKRHLASVTNLEIHDHIKQDHQ